MSFINRTQARADAAPTKDNAQGAGNPKGAQINASQVNHTPIRGRIKAAIVFLALWNLIPFALADFLIQRGGLKHE